MAEQGVPVPDPTVLTTAAVEKAMEAEEKRVAGQVKIIEARLDGMDTATNLRLKEIDHIPELVDDKIRSVEGVVDQKLVNVDNQFTALKERMAEQKTDTKQAVDAALAAAKEANTKSEDGTKEKIASLAAQTTTGIDALKEQVNRLEISVSNITAQRSGAVEQRVETRAQGNDSRAWITAAIAVVAFILTVVGFAIAQTAKPDPTPVVVTVPVVPTS